MSRIFISYSRQDASDVDPLAKSLEAAGHEVWIDRSAIQAGARWQAEIVTGIERADVFLILLTPASIQSENVERELGLAYVRNRAILPVPVRPVEVPPRLQYAFAGLEYVDVSQQEAPVAARRLSDAIASPTVRTQKVYLEGSWRDRLKPWLARVVWQQDAGNAARVIRALKSKGHEVVNESGAPLNDDALKNAIDGARTFLIVVPPTAANDVGDKIKELRFAQGSGRKIVPVTFGNPAIPSSMQLALSGVQCISLSPEPEIGVEPLLAALSVPARQEARTSPAAPPRSFLQRTVERLTGALLGGLAWAVGAALPVILSGQGWTTFHLLLAPVFPAFILGGLFGAALDKRRASVRKWGPAIWIAGLILFIFGFMLAAYLFSVDGISNERTLLGALLGPGSFTLGWLLEARLSAGQLKRKGKLLLTEYRGVRRDSSEIHNNRQYVQVVSEWRDPGTDQVHVFVSKDFSGDPSKRIRSNTIAVFVDPRNMKNYYMDLSYSAKTVKNDLVS